MDHFFIFDFASMVGILPFSKPLYECDFSEPVWPENLNSGKINYLASSWLFSITMKCYVHKHNYCRSSQEEANEMDTFDFLI